MFGFSGRSKLSRVLCSFRGGSASLVGLKRRHNTQSEAGNAKKRVTHDTFIIKWKRDLDRESQTVFEVVYSASLVGLKRRRDTKRRREMPKSA